MHESLCFSIQSPSPNVDDLPLRCDGCETVSCVVGSFSDIVEEPDAPLLKNLHFRVEQREIDCNWFMSKKESLILWAQVNLCFPYGVQTVDRACLQFFCERCKSTRPDKSSGKTVGNCTSLNFWCSSAASPCRTVKIPTKVFAFPSTVKTSATCEARTRNFFGC